MIDRKYLIPFFLFFFNIILTANLISGPRSGGPIFIGFYVVGVLFTIVSLLKDRYSTKGVLILIILIAAGIPCFISIMILIESKPVKGNELILTVALPVIQFILLVLSLFLPHFIRFSKSELYRYSTGAEPAVNIESPNTAAANQHYLIDMPIFPGDPLLIEMQSLFHSGNFTEAVKIGNSILVKNPENSRVLAMMGFMYPLVKGNYDKAKEFLQQAMKLDPGDSSAFNNFGYILWSEGNTIEARRYFETALSINPSDAGAIDNLHMLDSGVSIHRKSFGRSGASVFIFNAKVISGAINAFYGRYAYELLLPLILNKNPLSIIAADGDPIVGNGQFPIFGIKEFWDEVFNLVRIDDIFMILLVTEEPFDFVAIDKMLRGKTGYLGMTNNPSFGNDQFFQLSRMLSLPIAFSINDTIIKKESFNYFSDRELKQMGLKFA